MAIRDSLQGMHILALLEIILLVCLQIPKKTFFGCEQSLESQHSISCWGTFKILLLMSVTS